MSRKRRIFRLIKKIITLTPNSYKNKIYAVLGWRAWTVIGVEVAISPEISRIFSKAKQ
jgi:hypothetical protein